MTPLALDISIGLVILLSTLVAYIRGIVKEAFTLGGLIVAVLLAWKGGHILLPAFNAVFDVPADGEDPKGVLVFGLMAPSLAAKVFSYGTTFIGALFVAMLTGYFISRWINEAGLGVLDKIFGATFGFLRGFLLVFILYVPCTYIFDYKKFPDWALQSTSVPVLQSTLEWVNRNWDLDKKVQSKAEGVVIKFDKVDVDKIGDGDPETLKEELKNDIEREEKSIQKETPAERGSLNNGPSS